MYRRYATERKWKVEVLSEDVSERDGLNEAVFSVRGPDAWSRLEQEAGPHRVQRVPVTESKGRVHTSSATVTVLPEAEEVDVAIDPADLKIDVYRSTGPGGQSVNTTDSAVRITHLPTGIVVAMQDEKSQIQNRAKAMVVLRSRLLKAEQDRRNAELATQRRSQVGGGGRSEKIRTYNYKENRVTDHRVSLTLHKLDQVLAGDLDELTDALMADKRARQLAEQTAWRVSMRRARAARLSWPSRLGSVGPRPAGCSRRCPSVDGARRPGGPPPTPARPAGRPPAGRRTAAVPAGPLGLPLPGPAGRPPGTDPASRDRAGGRGGAGRTGPAGRRPARSGGG